MKILSFLWSQASTAVLAIDGEIVACVSEERFSRQKNDESYPKQAIEYVLAEGGIQPNELDFVISVGNVWSPRYMLTRRASSFSVSDRLREQQKYWYPVLYLGENPSYYELFQDKLDLTQYPGSWDGVLEFEENNSDSYATDNISYYQEFRRNVVAQHLGIEPTKIQFMHHHRSHGYYAYYASPIPKNERILILTADAWGDDMNATVSVAEDGQIQRLSTSTNFMLARLYRSLTLLLGMKSDEHEYKVMGLAAYAKPAYYQEALKVFQETQYVKGLGFDYHIKPPDMYVYFKDRLEGCRFDSIAGALQHYVEDTLCTWVRNAIAETNAHRVVFGGGMAMNVKAMKRLTELPEVEDIFVCPTPSDESLAAGAAYAAMHDICHQQDRDPRKVLQSLVHAYLGPCLSHEDVHRFADWVASDSRYVLTRGASDNYVARQLAKGKLLGRCVGRSEFGARALGNRSILADPRNPDVVRAINDSIKNRDFWMPFAPSILEERADDYLVNPKSIQAPYMTIAFDTTPLGAQNLKAALHQADCTCRPQIVTRKANPAYHSLISEFQNVTGVGALLNTSFNFHGKPIVQTAEDAFVVFEGSALDMLLVEDVLIEKRE